MMQQLPSYAEYAVFQMLEAHAGLTRLSLTVC